MRKIIKRDVCIVGGGASAMAAAIAFGRKLKDNNITDLKEKIIIVEKNEIMGKKVAASGNGRCNLTNENCRGCSKVQDFFKSIGLMTRSDKGWIYPYSEDGRSVSSLMISVIENLGIDLSLDTEVKEIKALKNPNKGFSVCTSEYVIECRKLLLATGGKAAPFFGTTGDGYKFASSLGHRINRLIPVLTPVDTEEEPKKQGLAGVRQKCKASLIYKGEVITWEEGQVQFTPTGLSGICIFNLSRYILLPKGKSLQSGFGEYAISLDLCPDITEGLLREFISRGSTEEMRDRLCTVVKPALADYILNKAFYEKFTKAFPRYELAKIYREPSIYEEFVRLLTDMIKKLSWEVRCPKGWDFCQATKGGVPLDEIDEQTMESKLVKGLYFAGEIMDYDGPCGGYNLQNAWETGLYAGESMALEELNAYI